MNRRWHVAILIAAFVFVPGLSLADQGISTLDQWSATTSPVSGITQRSYGKALILTGLSTGLCLSLDSNHQLTTTTCGAGGTGPATSTKPLMATYVVATSTSVASVFPLASTTALS